MRAKPLFITAAAQSSGRYKNMYIDGPKRPVTPASQKASSRSAKPGSAFSLGGQTQASGNAASSGVSTIANAQSLFAIQSIEDPEEKKKRAVKQGRSILDILDRLKIDLLEGNVNVARLNNLKTLIHKRPITGDPGLEKLMTAIELRASVELAKLERLSATGS